MRIPLYDCKLQTLEMIMSSQGNVDFQDSNETISYIKTIDINKGYIWLLI